MHEMHKIKRGVFDCLSQVLYSIYVKKTPVQVDLVFSFKLLTSVIPNKYECIKHYY